MLKTSRRRRIPDLIMWRGVGILSPKGSYLECHTDAPDVDKRTRLVTRAGIHVVERFRSGWYPKGSRLVLVTARVERATKRQIASFASPPPSALTRTRGVSP